MRHKHGYRRLSRTASHRKALLANLAIALIEGRGLNRYMEGKLSLENFANNLAHEWAGLPLVTGPNTGKSAYDGDGLNKAKPNIVQRFVSVLEDIKIRHAISSGGGQ